MFIYSLFFLCFTYLSTNYRIIKREKGSWELEISSLLEKVSGINKVPIPSGLKVI